MEVLSIGGGGVRGICLAFVIAPLCFGFSFSRRVGGRRRRRRERRRGAGDGVPAAGLLPVGALFPREAQKRNDAKSGF